MMARFPAPMAGWSAIVPTVVDCIVAALAKAMPDRVPAGHHGLLGGAVVFFGLHPKTGRRFVVQSLEGGGWGGRPFEDGESGTVSVCQGDVRNGSIEGIELKCPVLVESRALRPDSCGAGKYRGGLGIDMQVRNLVEGHWNFEQTRRDEMPALGPVGRHGRRTRRLSAAAAAGERIPASSPARACRCRSAPRRSCAPAAAAAGAIPASAIRQLVVDDVREELISRKAARDLYGVVVRDDFTLDAAATAALRVEMRAKSVRARRTDSQNVDGPTAVTGSSGRTVRNGASVVRPASLDDAAWLGQLDVVMA